MQTFKPDNEALSLACKGDYEEFYEQNQVRMGLLCHTPFTTVSQFAQRVREVLGHEIRVYPYGDEQLMGGNIALMGGGASNPNIYAELREKGVNLFLTGITWPEIPWVARNHAAAKEHGVTLVGGTHYSTEKFAPMEMVKFFEGLGLACEFIPETPRLQEL